MLRSAAASSLRKFKSDADTNNLNERFQVIPDLSGSKYVPSERVQSPHSMRKWEKRVFFRRSSV